MNNSYFQGWVKELQFEVKRGGAPEAAAELYPRCGGGSGWGCWLQVVPASAFPCTCQGWGLSSLAGGCGWDGQAGEQLNPVC